MVSLGNIKAAYNRIRKVTIQTPVMTSLTADRLTSCQVFFKCENFQRIGAFKFRGAYNAISQLSPKEKKRGVITHSSGNHAQAVALASQMLGVSATIVMPENSTQVKIDATRGYGATIKLCKPDVNARALEVQKLIKKHKYVLIHPYDNPRIIAGAGTAAFELIKEVGRLDAVLGPVGGGGLISGTSIATKGLCPNAKVYAVEPEQADDAYRSFTTGKLLPSVKPNTIADGLRTSLSDRTFSIIRQHVDDIITVSETEIIDAMKFLWERMKLIIEPSGAVPFAGLIKIKDQLVNLRIGIILSGGNVDLTQFFDQMRTQIEKSS
ncbi:MAG: pyridoxal-phosphate dependent enzyme [Candidatus Hermodarchaeia archaeon]|jgi:threonine dehydratase